MSVHSMAIDLAKTKPTHSALANAVFKASILNADGLSGNHSARDNKLAK